MKKILFGVLFLAGVSYAAPRVEEMPITEVGTATTVPISTYVWTAVPAATSLTSRSGLLVSVPASSNANVVGVLINCGDTAPATTIRPIEIVKGNGFTPFSIDQGVCLQLLSLHTSAENVHVIEVKH